MFLGFLIVPLVDWAHKADVMTAMFRYRPSRREQKDKDKKEKGDVEAEKELTPEQELLEQIKWDCDNTQKLPYKGFCNAAFWKCGKNPRYEWQMRKSMNIIKKEMDLPKFIHR